MLKKKLPLLIIFGLVIVIWYLFRFQSRSPVGVCTRTERYKNPPEFDRALSLIDQRLHEFDPEFSNRGIGNVINCLKVEYADDSQLEGSEGEFLFNQNKANSNLLLILVNKSYDKSDDLLTSVLLFHEMTHAIAYETSLQGHSLSCVDNEVTAFTMQLMYVRSMLNQNERGSIISRVLLNDQHPQLLILKDMAMLKTAAENFCTESKNPTQECVSQKEDELVRKWVESSPTYQKQCGI